MQWWALANAPVQQTSAGPVELGGYWLVAHAAPHPPPPLLYVEMGFKWTFKGK